VKLQIIVAPPNLYLHLRPRASIPLLLAHGGVAGRPSPQLPDLIVPVPSPFARLRITSTMNPFSVR
jgi:hypothetical protein